MLSADGMNLQEKGTRPYKNCIATQPEGTSLLPGHDQLLSRDGTEQEETLQSSVQIHKHQDTIHMVPSNT